MYLDRDQLAQRRRKLVCLAPRTPSESESRAYLPLAGLSPLSVAYSEVSTHSLPVSSAAALPSTKMQLIMIFRRQNIEECVISKLDLRYLIHSFTASGIWRLTTSWTFEQCPSPRFNSFPCSVPVFPLSPVVCDFLEPCAWPFNHWRSTRSPSPAYTDLGRSILCVVCSELESVVVNDLEQFLENVLSLCRCYNYLNPLFIHDTHWQKGWRRNIYRSQMLVILLNGKAVWLIMR